MPGHPEPSASRPWAYSQALRPACEAHRLPNTTPKRPSGAPTKRPKRSLRSVVRPADGSFAAQGSGTGFSKFNGASPFPSRWRVKLPYATQIAFTAGAAGLVGTEHIFRLNSAYDPDYSGAGNYPYGFAALAAIYGSYRVHAVLIDIVWTDPSADGCLANNMVQPSGATFTLAGVGSYVVDRQPGSDVRVLNNTGTQAVRITKRFTIAELEGLTKHQWEANPNYSATTSTNPSLFPLLRVGLACATTATPTATAQIRLEFDVEFFNRTVLTA
jgi:hypothetical protein